MTLAAPTTSVACGIDIGGSGVKSALVDLATGTFIGERVRIDTPEESTPAAVADVCRELLEQLEVGDDVPVGVALPAPIVHGTVPFIANLDKSWTGVNLTELMREHLGRPVTGLNDADAAGLAEVAFGAALGHVYDRWAQRTANPERAKRMGTLMATGLIVGESLAGVVYAGIVVAFGGKEDPLAIMPEGFAGIAPWVGLVLFVGTLWYLYRGARQESTRD